MKHSGKCPKCAGNKIIKVEKEAFRYRYAPQIPMGITIFSAIPIPYYVCFTCGYSETWIDEDELERLHKKYPEWHGAL